MRDLRRNRPYVVLAVVASAVFFTQSARLSAAPIAGSFDFKIDQNLIILDSDANIKNLETAIADGATGLEDSLAAAMANNMSLAAMWMPYTSILGMREEPALYLSNNNASNANITSFEINLDNGSSNQFTLLDNGDYFEESYASGEYTYIEMPSYNFSRIDPDQVPASVSVSNGGKKLLVTFGNGGIKPGRATTFLVGASTGMYLEDFFEEDTTIEVIYEDPNSDAIASSGDLPLSDITEFNEDLVTQVVNGTKNGLHFSSMVAAYDQPGLVFGIPEPTSILLGTCGLGFLAFQRRRKNGFV